MENAADLMIVLAKFTAIGVLSVLAITVLWKLMSGEIRTAGLLTNKVTREFSPGRLQLLILSLIGAGMYLVEILANSDGGALPSPSNNVLATIAGSQAFYLGGKSEPVLSKFIRRFIGT